MQCLSTDQIRHVSAIHLLLSALLFLKMYLPAVIGLLSLSSAIIAGWTSESCPSTDECCPPMWQPWNDSCYRLIEQANTWNDSASACRELGAEMAAPSFSQENKFLARLAKNKGVHWLWVDCKNIQGRWQCGGREGIDYRNWAPGRPSNGSKEDCASMRTAPWTGAADYNFSMSVSAKLCK